MAPSNFETLIYEIPEPGIARIRLNRPDRANAQDTQLLYELNEAFDRAAHDDEVRVIILAAEGKHFSAGHDLSEANSADAMKRYRTVGTMCGFGCAGAEAQMSREEEIYVGFSERWRNIPKPTIAAVQGKCIAGGLMLAWPCDLIVPSPIRWSASGWAGSSGSIMSRSSGFVRPRKCCSRRMPSALPKR
jgi:enoyl-CoA hydratase